jgi:hypothetical protein
LFANPAASSGEKRLCCLSSPIFLLKYKKSPQARPDGLAQTEYKKIKK